jgi:hypothetical protein
MIWSEPDKVEDAKKDRKLNADDGYLMPRYKFPEPRGLQASWNVKEPETATVWEAYE